MNGTKALNISEVRKVEINFERVVTWSLIFTNAFYISYFFAKLFNLV